MINESYSIDANSPEVCIIVPVYNIERYLRQCLDSIIHQTLTNIEIIIIDDGSVDDSGIICDEYARTDKRVQVVHRANEGLSCARNYGVSISTAPFIMFVDGDDWVDPQFCELPYTMASKNNADLVLFKHRTIETDGAIQHSQTEISTGLVSEKEALNYNLYCANAAWLGLYHRDLFNEIQFPVEKYYEDVGTIHRLIHNSKRIFMLNTELYNHRIGRPGSITAFADSKSHCDLREMLISRAVDLNRWGYKVDALIIMLNIMIKYGYTDIDSNELVHLVKTSNLTSGFKMKLRLMHVLFKISPSIFDKVCIITGRRIRS